MFENFVSCVKTVLNYLKENQSMNPHLLIASHNEKSIRLAVENMKNVKISCNDNLVSFAQIYGMADYLSTPLGTYLTQNTLDDLNIKSWNELNNKI